jgi:type VI secretion system protein ImpH
VASAHRPAATGVSDFDDLLEEPWRFDLLGLLRDIERRHPEVPRIGDSSVRREDIVSLGMNPFLEFPASTIEAARRDKDGRLTLFVRFLGLLGPQGPLPLATTEEAYSWLARDDAFPRFLDLFNNRFLQLFFRAWADARPIAQADQPERDRFSSYVGSTIGLGTPTFRDLDSVADAGKLAFAGLMAPQAKSAGRLEQVITGLFGVRAEVSEFVGSWLALEPGDRTRLGARKSGLGGDMLLGARVFSVQDKIRIRAIAPDLATYRRLLPTGDLSGPLADIVFFYLGFELEWDLELGVPAGRAEPVRLGRSGQVGWTSWIAPQWAVSDETLRTDVRLHVGTLGQARDDTRAKNGG